MRSSSIAGYVCIRPQGRDSKKISSTPPTASDASNRNRLCLKVVQEALTNAAKHTNASHVRIECRNEPKAVRITIADDGRGIDAAAHIKPDSLGLLGLNERLTAIGGALTVSNLEPSGVLIDARVPIL
jgi:signal transduction histidine kinase